MAAINDQMDVLGARGGTGSAADAQSSGVEELTVSRLGFRIVAPGTREGQPLKKTVVRIPGPSCIQNRWISKIRPTTAEGSIRRLRHPERMPQGGAFSNPLGLPRCPPFCDTAMSLVVARGRE